MLHVIPLLIMLGGVVYSLAVGTETAEERRRRRTLEELELEIAARKAREAARDS